MKKILKIILEIILAIFFWICAILFLVETIKSFYYLDPWGLGFTFYTLPIGILGIMFLILAVYFTKKLISNKK